MARWLFGRLVFAAMTGLALTEHYEETLAWAAASAASWVIFSLPAEERRSSVGSHPGRGVG